MSSQIVTLDLMNFTPVNNGLTVNSDGKIENPLGIEVEKSIILRSFESYVYIKGSVYKVIKWEMQHLRESIFDVIELESDNIIIDLSSDELEVWLMNQQLPVL